MADWIATKDRLPDQGVVVDTKIDDADGVRNEGQLKRQGNLWFFADGSMYVYYRPTHWRAADPTERARELNARLASINADREKVQAELAALSLTTEQEKK